MGGYYIDRTWHSYILHVHFKSTSITRRNKSSVVFVFFILWDRNRKYFSHWIRFVITWPKQMLMTLVSTCPVVLDLVHYFYWHKIKFNWPSQQRRGVFEASSVHMPIHCRWIWFTQFEQRTLFRSALVFVINLINLRFLQFIANTQTPLERTFPMNSDDALLFHKFIYCVWHTNSAIAQNMFHFRNRFRL